ncbi:MAG: GyrI-like domain-containing protein [Bacteroidetes bacterium]|nr:GyrI-like domain-containing protein [Bacteroidota bacterium]
MVPILVILPAQKFVGKKIRMSFSANRTFELWKSFMPLRKEIKNAIGNKLYSIEVYPPSFFDNFNPDAEFEKWAAVEVKIFEKVPEDMETLTSPEGLYAIFTHKGPACSGPVTYDYIFRTWLPGSDFILDQRPHFAVMGEKYKHEDPESEEDILIPVKSRQES